MGNETKIAPYTDSDHISSRLMKVRMIRSLKQSYIGQHMGITQQAYSILENKKGSIGINTLKRFCKATNVSIELLVASSIPITQENIDFFNENDLSLLIDGYRRMEQQIQFYESMILIKQAS